MNGEDLFVPVEWLYEVTAILGSLLVGAFVWWVKKEFDKNDMEHDRTYKAICHIHRRLDFLGVARDEPGDKP